MTSQFDMNAPAAACKICMDIHAQHNPCKYDNLIRTIVARNSQLGSQQAAMVKMYNRLCEFQAVIKQMTPELERLVLIEEKYKDLTHGTKDIQATAPEQLSFQGI